MSELRLLASPLVVAGAYLYASQAHKVSICVSFKGASTQVKSLFRALHNLTANSSCSESPSDFNRIATTSSSTVPPLPCILCPGYNIWGGTRSSMCEQRVYSARFLHVLLLREPLERLVSAYLDRCAGPIVHKCHGCICRHERTPSVDGMLALLRRLNETLHSINSMNGTILDTWYDGHFRTQTSDCSKHFQSMPTSSNAVSSVSSQRSASTYRIIRWSATRGSCMGAASLHEQMQPICAELVAQQGPASSSVRELCELNFPTTSTAVHKTNASESSSMLHDPRIVELARHVYAKDFEAFYGEARSSPNASADCETVATVL